MNILRPDQLFSTFDLTDLTMPSLLPFVSSAWHEQIPVAHWLIKATRPRTLVELGTHTGVSFSAFCSAMRRYDIAGDAFSIESWRREEHNNVSYEQLKAVVDGYFKDFAQLIRKEFDEAQGLFPENSIDFLHVNNCHSYEVVKHDFETWTGKLSERGVVIFHNINCRDPEFGVCRFWEEISHKFASFAFLHGSGLGLIAVGTDPPDPIRALTGLSNDRDIARVREWFALAGRAHSRVYGTHAQGEDRLALLLPSSEKITVDHQRIDHEREELLSQQKRLEIEVAKQRQDALLAQAKLGEARAQIEHMKSRTIYLEREFSALVQKHSSLMSSLSWRITRPLRSVRAKTRLSAERINLLSRAFHPDGSKARYILLASFMRRAGLESMSQRILPKPPESNPSPLAEVNAEDIEIINDLLERGELPVISALIIMVGMGEARLGAVIRALDAQIVPVRQIIISASPDSPASNALNALVMNRTDVRVVWGNSAAIPDIEPADAVLLLCASTTPKPHATAVFATELRAHDAELVYADEIFVRTDGVVSDPFFKPAYSPRLAARSDYMGQCALLAIPQSDTHNALVTITQEIDEAGSVSTFLTKRGADAAKYKVRRTPFVLFTETDPSREILRVPTRLSPRRRDQTVAILIPTRDRLDLLEPCIESILAKTDYLRDAYEIIVIDNGSTDPSTLRYLNDGQSSAKFRVVRDNGEFNYARLNNLAARATTAAVLLFLNNDTLIIQPDWLARLVDGAMQDGVGMVGAKLLYRDGTIQHGGVILGIQGVAAHADVSLPANSPGYHGLAWHDREVSAVTGACMATRRDHFWSVGGFDENLAVAFNDVLLCVNMLKAGLVNVILNSVEVTHLESKSRGLDDTLEKQQIFASEWRYTREKGHPYFDDDIYYSPNLSIQEVYQTAMFTRRRKPWRSPVFKLAPRVLILSSTHQRGHGVPVVIERHTDYMAELGWDVHVGGPISSDDHVYRGCTRVAIESPVQALRYALEQDVDIVMPHTPPFFSVSRGVGPYPFVAAYDYGEPPPYLFPDAQDRWNVLKEKAFSLSLAHRIYGISESVKDESGFTSMVVMPLGNSHMSHWSADKSDLRRKIREAHGWSDKTIVLNVCRFQKAERHYKGVDFFIDVARQSQLTFDNRDPSIIFVQCGKADSEDVAYVKAEGLEAFSNVTDDQMLGLYCAADIYANFSKWEGWNLGIAQALAYGLPVIASDIPAHRKNFDILTAADAVEAWQIIAATAHKLASDGFESRREAIIQAWASRLKVFTDDISNYWRKS